MEAVWRIGLEGTELAKAQVGTIRLKLLKIGTVIVRNTRRIRLFFSSAYPYQDGERTTGQRMRRFGCRPRHAKNNGGKGECAPALVIRLKTNQNPPLVAMRTPRPA